MRLFISILITVLLIVAHFNFASAYSIDTIQKTDVRGSIDQNIATKAISDSIRDVVDNVLKSFSSGQSINVKNIPKIPQMNGSSEISKNISNISSGGVIILVEDFIKLSINLLFASILVVTEILKALLNSLNSHGG